ncbi:hypothetical protein ACF1FX_33705 [Streptomyces sp. NPDC014646]|uniref:hypothetical protein n=1 Tax=Streptomyces sp. NPDC014646 TaxID=3364877 RepID=UPI0036F747D3
MTTILRLRLQLRVLGYARLRLALLVAAMAATTLTLLTSLPAHAEPTPTPAPTVPAAPGHQAPTAAELEDIEQILKEQSERLSKSDQEAKLKEEKERLRKLLPDEGGVLGVFDVTDANNLPISIYTIKSDTGGMLDWDLGIQNLLAEICFMLTKWAIAFCCWLIAWSLSFGLAKLLLTPALSVANSLHARVVLEMGLPTLFLAVCALVCTARIFFGDKVRGFGDAALSLLLAALTATLLASPPQVLLGEETGAIAVARGLALEVADVILDASPGAPAQDNSVTTPATATTLSRPLTDALTDAFITKPAMLLQYGRVFEGECATAYSQTRIEQLAFDRAVHARTKQIKKAVSYTDYLSPSAWVGLPSPADTINATLDIATRWAVDHYGTPPMERFEEKCVPGDVAAAKKASLDKVGGAFFLLVAALVVAFLITALTGSFLTAQAGIAWDAVRGEPALIAGVLPGAGRAFLWDWASAVLHRLGQMLVSVIGLAVLILMIQAVLNPAQTDWGRELTLRFLIVDILCIAAITKRKKLAERSRQVANNFRTKMTGARIGGTHGSILTPPATSTVPQNRHIVRKAARCAVRTALVGASLAHGNPLAALGYAMPQTIGATALMTRLQTGGRHSGPRRARPAGRTGPKNTTPRQPAARTHPARTGQPAARTRPAPPSQPAARTHPAPTNQSGASPRPARPTQSTTPSTPAPRPRTTPTRTPRPASTNPTAPTPTTSTTRPRHRHAQAHRAVQRRTQRAATPPNRSTSGPGGFDDWLADRERQELARRRRTHRS